VGDDQGGLNAQDLVPAAGGEWHGLLFDNQAVGVPPALTWTFRIPFEPVGGEPATLDVDWLPIPAPGWRQLAGRSAASDSFAEPAEATVSFQSSHHRYDRVRVEVAEQDGDRLRAVVTVSGDIDGLGPATITADAWLRFTGISVQLGGAGTADEARSRLAEFTDVDGLVEQPDAPGVAVQFAPAP
jgi:hypothetical protein